jgi:hypothetical protein
MTLPEFDVTVMTVRSGTQTFRIQADDGAAARNAIESDLREDRLHCPAEWCTDDVQSEVLDVRMARPKVAG